MRIDGPSAVEIDSGDLKVFKMREQLVAGHGNGSRIFVLGLRNELGHRGVHGIQGGECGGKLSALGVGNEQELGLSIDQYDPPASIFSKDAIEVRVFD